MRPMATSSMPAASRAVSRSKYTLPVHSTSLRTFSSATRLLPVSGIRRLKEVPGRKSSMSDLTRRWRRSDFGDIITRGLRKSRHTCRRSMWK